MKRILFLSVFFWVSGTIAQPTIEWQKSIGGSGDDNFKLGKQTSDGGFIICGNSNSTISGDIIEDSRGLRDWWVIKLDASRNIQWQRFLGGTGDEAVHAIHQTSDGGYILGGYTNTTVNGNKTAASKGGQDYWVVKLNDCGHVQWQKTYGGSGDDRLLGLYLTSSGNYLLCGDSMSGIGGDKTEANRGSKDYWILEVNTTGAIVWQKTLGGTDDESAFALYQTSEGGYIVSGPSKSNANGDKTSASRGNFDIWVMKLDASRNITWQKTIGGSDWDDTRSLLITSDGGYLIAASSKSGVSGDKTEANKGDWDYWVVKLNSSGDISWQKTIGGTGYDWINYDGLAETANGGFVIAGDSDSPISGNKTTANIGDKDLWVVKLNASGTILWDKSIGGTGADYMHAMHKVADGEYILGGYSASGISGDKTEASKGGNDGWMVKITENPTGRVGNPRAGSATTTMLVAPNPASDHLKVQVGTPGSYTLQLFDIQGRLVHTSTLQGTEAELQTRDLTAGAYTLVLNGTEGELATQRIVIGK